MHSFVRREEWHVESPQRRGSSMAQHCSGGSTEEDGVDPRPEAYGQNARQVGVP
jgi:hypothetical protein